MSFLYDMLTAIIQRTHWERVIFSEPDRTKQLEKLAEAIQKVPKPSSPEHKPSNEVSQPMPQVSAEDMLRYQKKELYGQLWLLQGHATNGSRINNEPCDCLLKHAIAVAALAEETQPMEPRNPLWGEIKDFANSIVPKAQVDQVIKGNYASEYPIMASKVRDLRKRIDIGQPAMTLEDAKAEAASIAAEEVERQWKEKT